MKYLKIFEEENKLPSRFQIGDIVDLKFGNSGILKSSRIIEVHFEEDKVYYDVEVLLSKDSATRIHHIDSVIIKKVK